MADPKAFHDVGAAVIGAGFIGPAHVEALRRLGVRVEGVAGSRPEHGPRIQAQLGLPKAYADLDAALADPAVDVVHVATPNALHYEMSKKALAAGKHVMCEKPLAMTSEESAELVRLAQKSGKAAGVCYNLRYYPLNLQAQQMVAGGDVGSIYSVTGGYVQDWLFYDTDYNWRVLADQGGALRAIADIGTHWLDLVTTITGLKIEAVCADLHTVHPKRKRPVGEVQTFSGKTAAPAATEEIGITTEDFGGVLLKFEGGARGQFHVSQVTAGRKNMLRYEISGSKLALAWNSETPNEMWIGRREEPNRTLLRDPSLLDERVRPYANYPGGHNEGFPDAFKQCFRAFYQAVLGLPASERLAYPTFEDGHREALLCEAILESHQTQRWIPVKE